MTTPSLNSVQGRRKSSFPISHFFPSNSKHFLKRGYSMGFSEEDPKGHLT
jgi:hypothetical protein